MGRKAGIDIDRITEAAAGIADAAGLDAVTLAAVAAELGIRSPSLYNHIGGLEDLHRLLSRRGAAELGAALEAAAEGSTGAGAIERIATAYRTYAIEHPGLYAASQIAVTEEEDPETFAVMGRVVEVVARPLREMDLADSRVVDAVRSLRALLHGFVVLETGRGFGLADEVGQSFEYALGAMVSGLGGRS